MTAAEYQTLAAELKAATLEVRGTTDQARLLGLTVAAEMAGVGA